MSSNPFYHLRPNKYIDRHLFIEFLEYYNTVCQIENYQYIGFGSYMFDDFKLLHNRYNISDMISLEVDNTQYKRAIYNLPYKCIKVINKSSTDYINDGELDESKNKIIWLDYCSPEIGAQFNDIASIYAQLNLNDVLRITFNANPASMGSKQSSDEDAVALRTRRLHKLDSYIHDYISDDIKEEHMTHNGYPIVLIKCLKNLLDSLREPLINNKFIIPAFTNIYEDGQQMLTITLVVVTPEIKEKLQTKIKKNKLMNFSWDNPLQTKIPSLTTKEIIEINTILPQKGSKTIANKILKKLPFIFSEENRELELYSYISYYKIYPHFHNINFWRIICKIFSATIGETLLPIWRKLCHIVSEKTNQSGNPCILAASLGVITLGFE